MSRLPCSDHSIRPQNALPASTSATLGRGCCVETRVTQSDSLTAASTLWFPYRSIQTRSKYGRDYLGSDFRLQDHRVREVAHMDGAGRASEEGRARGLVAISCHDGFSQCL